jgi:hypothetical protein
MTRSPKARFQDDAAAVSQHAELMVNPKFLHAIDMAMCQLVHVQPMVKDAHGSMAMAHRIEGANFFIEVLKGLSDKGEVVTRKSVGNLDGNVRAK